MSPVRFALRLLSSALVVITAGCAVGPDYHRPDAPLPDRYLGQVPTPDSTAAPELANWWQAFQDPELTSFVARALEQNLDLAQAAARVGQARAGLGAANAALLPSAALSGASTRAYQSVQTPLGQVLEASPGFERWGELHQVDLGASWELDLSGGLRRGRQAALADLQASGAAEAATRLAVAAQTAETYIAIRGLQARLDIARRQVQARQGLLSKVGLLHARGLAATSQVRQAEGALAQAQASIPALTTALDAAMNALDVMVGVAPGTYRRDLERAGPIPVTPRIASMGSPSDLLHRRPDLIVAERRLVATNARIGEAMSEYYPKFSLSGLLGSATAGSSSDLFTGGASQAAGVLGLRWRLFDFGRINAQIELAKGRDAEAIAAYRQAVLRATEDVENAFSALLNRGQQVTILTEGEAALSQARQSAFAAYGRGAASLIDVLHADEALLQASDARAQAQAESARAAVAAYRSLGGGWQLSSSAAAADQGSDGEPRRGLALGHN